MDIIAKTRADYNKIARDYAKSRPKVWAELFQFKSFVANGQRILDWGCGHGRLINLFDGFSVEYFGVDQSAKLLALAQSAYADSVDQGWAHFYSSARHEKKFPANFFDLAFMVASLLHLPTPQNRLALLKKTYHELKPGGRLIITVWNLSSAWAKGKKFGCPPATTASGLACLAGKKLGVNDYLIPWKDKTGKILAERYYHNFTPVELKKLLTRAGFVVERIEFMSQAQSSDSKGGRNLVAVAAKP